MQHYYHQRTGADPDSPDRSKWRVVATDPQGNEHHFHHDAAEDARAMCWNLGRRSDAVRLEIVAPSCSSISECIVENATGTAQ